MPSPDAFARTVGRLGIAPDDRIVVYDDAGGAKAAARAWWMLRAIGHEAVAVLDGGLDAARAAGIPLSDDPSPSDPRAPYPAEPLRWRLPIATIDEVASGELTVIDVRAPERYRGEVEPYDPRAGHIPGAINLPLSEHLDERGRFMSPEALRALYRSIDPEHTIISCGSGVTACHTLLALERAGMGGARLYVGSWSEWCRSGRETRDGARP